MPSAGASQRRVDLRDNSAIIAHVKVEFSSRAASGLLEIPTRERARLQSKIEAFAATPKGPHGKWWKFFSPTEGRIRQGDWRALYLIDWTAETVFVIEVLHRRDAY
jgi:mRNA-degrading endonuclease RelE of RelBE toxin-antitoxin system